MSAVPVEPLDVFEVLFTRSRAHAAAVEGKLSATEMMRAPHTDVEALCDVQGRGRVGSWRGGCSGLASPGCFSPFG